MAVFKCKMCGANLEISEKQSVVTCEYCNTQQTLPKIDDEKKLALFNRANNLRLKSEFDKAAGIYESIVAEFPEEAEAYWGLVLCKYGIEYVDDKDGKKIPTCHRTLPTSIMKDRDFEQACENADITAKAVYRDEAKVIDGIQKKILEIVATEKPYDIFICYKETDDVTGTRTEDSSIAQDVYTALTELGYKVFYARNSLRKVAGTEYEPYIYAALSSAKVMLVIGTKYEYYDSVWVKNEWSRFISMMADNTSKVLIPCFKNMDAYDIPEEFSNMQALDMSTVTFFGSLEASVKRAINFNADKNNFNVEKSVTKKPTKKIIGFILSLVSVIIAIVLSFTTILPRLNSDKEAVNSSGKIVGFKGDGNDNKTSEVNITFSAEIGEIEGKIYAVDNVGRVKNEDGFYSDYSSEPIIPRLPIETDDYIMSFAYYDGYVYYITSPTNNEPTLSSLYRCKSDFTGTELLLSNDYGDDYTQNYVSIIWNFIIEDGMIFSGAANDYADGELYQYLDLTTMELFYKAPTNYHEKYNVSKGSVTIYNDNVFCSQSGSYELDDVFCYQIKNNEKQDINFESEQDGDFVHIPYGYADGYIYYSEDGEMLSDGYNAYLKRIRVSDGEIEIVDKFIASGGCDYFHG